MSVPQFLELLRIGDRAAAREFLIEAMRKAYNEPDEIIMRTGKADQFLRRGEEVTLDENGEWVAKA